MFRALILTTLATFSLMAVEYKTIMPSQADQDLPQILNIPYAKDYIQIGKGNWNPSIEAIVKSDLLFAKANNILNKEELFVSKSVPASLDPEDKNTKMVQRKFPDFLNAIKGLAESAKTYQNPVSAYEAVMLSNRIYGKGTGSPIASDMAILTKLMYASRTCEGYILYGEILEQSGNKIDAFDVYKHGANDAKCGGWYQSVIGGKISYLKKAVGK